MTRQAKPDRDAQFDRELRFHIEKLIEEKIAAGVSPDEARRQAILEFGGSEQLKEDLRDIYRVRFVESAVRNLRSAFRFIRKSPSFSATIIATLALGIGANTAVFSAIDAIILRPLPFPQGDQLMDVAQYNPTGRTPGAPVAPARLEDWNKLNSTFQAITGYYTEDVSETSGPLPEKLTKAWVAPRFFQVWGVSPAIGRGFVPAEQHLHGPNAVVISDRFWRRRFGGDVSALGKQLRLEGYSYTIVGIMPASFRFAVRDVDLWSPAPVDFPLSRDNRELTWYTCVGRLKPGIRVSEALADLATVQAQLGHEYPKTDAKLAVRIEPLKEIKIGGSRRSLWVLFGSVSLLLLLACCNIASLLLAQMTRRRHEIGIRFSLGASRSAVTMQLLVEIFVLALAGGLLGLLLAGGAAQAFRALAKDLPRAEEIRLNGTILGYSFVCSIAATLLCGLLPALRVTSRNPAGILAQSSRTQVAGGSMLQWGLVSVQVALAVTLLAGAGLLLRSFQALGRVSPGFDPTHVLTLRISGSYGETADIPTMTRRIERTLDSVRTVPGVEGAATSLSVPGTLFQFQSEVRVSGEPAEAPDKILILPRYVSAGYFETMHIPLLAGELCRESLVPNRAVVNRTFVDRYLAGGTVIGRHVEPANPGPYSPPPADIQGIVGDAREQGLDHDPAPTVYWCFSGPNPSPAFLIRTHGHPMAMADVLRRKIHEIEPGRSVFDVLPLTQHLSDNFAENRLRTILLTFFAVTAVLLACLGLYGTLSYFVNIRRREVGLRLALGAARQQIIGQFLLYGFRTALLGCAAGLCLTAAFARVLSGMLYGISNWDATTLIGVVFLIIATAGISALVPAIRAARVEPMQVLREE